MVKIPRHDTIEFALSVLAALDGRPTNVDRRVSVQPLLAEHRQEGGEQRSGETREEDYLNLYDRVCGTSPLWGGGNIIAEGGVVDLVNQDTEESGCLFVRVWLELGVDLDDERGSDGRKETSL